MLLMEGILYKMGISLKGSPHVLVYNGSLRQSGRYLPMVHLVACPVSKWQVAFDVGAGEFAYP